MNKEQKNDVIDVLKDKFSQYSNFYIANTESLTVAQITNLRRVCYDKQVEMKVAKNTLIKKALESLDAEKYSGVYEALHNVTALMFSENPKEPAMILTGFRKDNKSEKPVLKAAFINGDVYLGDNQLVALTKIKSKNELLGEVIGLLQSPAQRVIAALLNGKGETPVAAAEELTAPVAETTAPAAVEAAAPVVAEVAPAPVEEAAAVAAVEAAPEAEAAAPAADEAKPAADAPAEA